MFQLQFQEVTRQPESKPELKLEKGVGATVQSNQKKGLLFEKDRPEENTSFELKPDQQVYYQDQYFKEQKTDRRTHLNDGLFFGNKFLCSARFGSGNVNISMEKYEFERMKMNVHVDHDHTTENEK